jgi:hypothetical protein
MHKIKTISRVDWIDCVASIGQYLFIYIKGEGLDPLKVGSRINSVGLANKSRKKYETLTDSAYVRTAPLHAWTVRTPTVQPQTGPSAMHF